jgi:uncharacterized protein (TIGR03435 family)
MGISIIRSFATNKPVNEMKKLLIALLLSVATNGYAQNFILKPGDHFPDLVIGSILNAPVKELYLNHDKSKKIFILNVWGTWCAPCIPEMDSLAKLQRIYGNKIQVIGISDDSHTRLKKYLAKKPSSIWLSTDPLYSLSGMLNLSSVGQSAIIGTDHKILALVKTESINKELIRRLLKGDPIISNAEIATPVNRAEKDAFGMDSLTTVSFTLRGYMKGEQTKGQHYNTGPFADRRVSYFNVCPNLLYKEAYDIISEKQVVYENVIPNDVCDFADKNKLYCFDLLVSPEQKDSLKIIMQRKLRESLPVKGRVETRNMPVYVLKIKGDNINMPLSTAALDYSFSGTGFDGRGITMNQFANIYLSNELELPVIDDTGLRDKYDIKTNNDMRNKDSILAAIDKLGLKVEKSERLVKVLVLYK